MSKTGPGPAVQLNKRIELDKAFFERLETDYQISLDCELRAELKKSV